MNLLMVSTSAATRAWLGDAARFLDAPAEVNFSEDVAFAMSVLQVHDDVHVILVDLDAVEGVAASIKELWRAGRSAAVVAVVEQPTAAGMVASVGAGAMAYVPRSTPPAELSQILKCVQGGVVWIPSLRPEGRFRPC